jgi:hypothetical protein
MHPIIYFREDIVFIFELLNKILIDIILVNIVGELKETQQMILGAPLGV